MREGKRIKVKGEPLIVIRKIPLKPGETIPVTKPGITIPVEVPAKVPVEVPLPQKGGVK